MTPAHEVEAIGPAEAQAYVEYLASPPGRLRCELLWGNLAAALPRAGQSRRAPRALDAGGGSGELAQRLVRLGFDVVLLDSSRAMLAQARRRLGTSVELVHGDLARTAELLPKRRFEVVVCHLAIEYVADPDAALLALASVLGPSGLLSLAFRNACGEPFKLAAEGDLAGARASLDADGFATDLLRRRGRLLRIGSVRRRLRQARLRVFDSAGIRVFPALGPTRWEDQLALERDAARRPPLRRVARYVQLLARREIGAGR